MKSLDSSLKRHTALIKRIRQSLAIENHDQVLKDIESLSLEKYVDEISGAVIEGIGRCKTEKDVWSAVEVSSSDEFPGTDVKHCIRSYQPFTDVSLGPSPPAWCPP